MGLGISDAREDMLMDVMIRPERAEDVERISRITEEAFREEVHSSHTEHHIITELRRRGALSCSLVAVWKEVPVGHIAFSPVEISDGSACWYGLGPVAVTREWQGKGIGQALVSAGLAALRLSGAAGCVVLGEPGFYERFGFRQVAGCVLEGVPPEYFQVLPFGRKEPTGTVRYDVAFSVEG